MQRHSYSFASPSRASRGGSILWSWQSLTILFVGCKSNYWNRQLFQKWGKKDPWESSPGLLCPYNLFRPELRGNKHSLSLMVQLTKHSSFLKQTLQKAPEGSGDIQELQYPTKDTHLNPLLCTVEFFLLFLPPLELGKHFTGGLSFHHQNYKLFRPVKVCSQPSRHHQNSPHCSKRSCNSPSNAIFWRCVFVTQGCPTEEARHELQEGSYAG